MGFGVKDIKSWENYATDMVGLQVSERLDNGTLYLRQDEYHHRFIIEPTGEDDVKYMGWMVSSHDDLAEYQSRLKAIGIEVDDGSPEECQYRKVDEFITFKDPSGNRIELFYGFATMAARRFQSPLHLSQFVTGSQGFGHIGLCVDDVDESERFYRDILGFRLTDHIVNTRPDGEEMKMAFFHVNPRHHSLALFPMFPNSKQRMNHIMMQVNDIDDVGVSYDMVQERGIAIRGTLGRHVNDRMISYFMETPSPFSIEIGWGAREVDDDTWQVQMHRTTAESPGHIWGHHGMGGRPSALEGARSQQS